MSNAMSYFFNNPYLYNQNINNKPKERKVIAGFTHGGEIDKWSLH